MFWLAMCHKRFFNVCYFFFLSRAHLQVSALLFALSFKMCKWHLNGKPVDLEIDLLFGFIFYMFSVCCFACDDILRVMFGLEVLEIQWQSTEWKVEIV